MTPSLPSPTLNRRPVTRRALLRYGAAGIASLTIAGAGWNPAAVSAAVLPSEPSGCRTWLLATGDELRPRAPASPSRAELDELLDLQARRTTSTADMVARWGDGPAVLPWTALALDLIAAHKPSPVHAARALALLHVALYDTAVASRDAQDAFRRPAPLRLDRRLVPLGEIASDRPSFPSDHAAVAGAAATVLAHVFPDEPAAGLRALADEAATSRLWAGASVRSDIEAGLALGHAVGARAVARGETDGSDAIWDGTGRLTGAGTWQPTPPKFVEQPLDPLAGIWRPWILASGDQFRPGPPPAYGSPAWATELASVQDAVSRRTPEQEAVVHFWAGGPGTMTPPGIWTAIARDLIRRDGLDLPHAARVLALTSIAMFDAFVCCWDAKYTYWTARPITADPTLDVLIPTPPFPSYTSGHSTISAAAATVLGYLFPADTADLTARATEAKQSQLWAGIHFPRDNEMGAAGGNLVARLVVAHARSDGAE